MIRKRLPPWATVSLVLFDIAVLICLVNPFVRSWTGIDRLTLGAGVVVTCVAVVANGFWVWSLIMFEHRERTGEYR